MYSSLLFFLNTNNRRDHLNLPLLDSTHIFQCQTTTAHCSIFIYPGRLTWIQLRRSNSLLGYVFMLHLKVALNLMRFQYLLAKYAFEKGDDEEREWMMEVMYESYRKFYSKSVHVVDKVSF